MAIAVAILNRLNNDAPLSTFNGRLIRETPLVWGFGPIDREKQWIRDQLDAIRTLTARGLTGSGVVAAYHKQRVAPIMARSLMLCEMVEGAEPTETVMLLGELSDSEIRSWLRDVFESAPAYPDPQQPAMLPDRGALVVQKERQNQLRARQDDIWKRKRQGLMSSSEEEEELAKPQEAYDDACHAAYEDEEEEDDDEDDAPRYSQSPAGKTPPAGAAPQRRAQAALREWPPAALLLVKGRGRLPTPGGARPTPPVARRGRGARPLLAT
ncbi:hypothetical protein PVAP13_8KG111620 [Panicum virgatum]|uniref:Uncharacterized protein n=1 Tax=Panicum virgatum TaxID=38727 RepID=A0A8T0PHX1_PANVG|nr:hypothetical protein PVAP13_8KG111620 [Panicum virgatum]